MWRFRISPRSLAIWAAIFGVGCLALRAVGPDTSWATVLRFFVPLAVTGFLPGLIALVWARPASNLPLFDAVAISGGLSLGLAQLLVFFAVGFGIEGKDWGYVLPLAVAGIPGILFLLHRDRPSLMIVVRPLSVMLLAALAALIAILYTGGNFSIVSWVNEDHMHLAIVRRLIEEHAPTPDNIHFVKGITYTYPFPGIHYFYALTSVVARLDPIFVYDKMGAYWSVMALTGLFAFTRTVLRSQRVAMTVLALALALILLGPFANVPGFYWGQLSPMPHVSDVAMNVVLPMQLLFVVRFIVAPNGPAVRFYLAAGILMTAMVSAVHVREFIQYFVYMVVGTIVLTVAVHPKRHRAVAMLGVSIMLFAGYYAWHRMNVPNVTSLISRGHEAFVAHVASLTFSELFAPLRPYASGIRQTMYHGLGGLMLAAAPVAAVVYRRRPFVWMMMLSIFLYLAIIRIGVLAIPYVFFTFDEILSSAMRNIVFFGYVLLGGGVYWLVWRVDRLIASDPAWAQVLTATCVGLLIGMLAWLSERAGTRSNTLADLGLLVLLAAAGLGVATMCVLDAKRPVSPLIQQIRTFIYGEGPKSPGTILRWRLLVVAVGLMLPAAVFTTKPHESPIRKALREPMPLVAGDVIGQYYPRFAQMVLGARADGIENKSICRRAPAADPSDENFHVTGDDSGLVLWCVPSSRLVRWLLNRVGPDAIMMINPANAYQAIPLFRGRLVAPSPLKTLRGWADVLPEVRRAVADAWDRHGGMPIFNDVENAESRFVTLNRLGATHLLVDPMFYDPVMNAVRDRPDLFRVVYDESDWAVVALIVAKRS